MSSPSGRASKTADSHTRRVAFASDCEDEHQPHGAEVEDVGRAIHESGLDHRRGMVTEEEDDEFAGRLVPQQDATDSLVFETVDELTQDIQAALDDVDPEELLMTGGGDAILRAQMEVTRFFSGTFRTCSVLFVTLFFLPSFCGRNRNLRNSTRPKFGHY
jgi:hypothetical protein